MFFKKKKKTKAKKRTVSQEFKRKDFRVSIFGSARIQPGDKTYKEVFNLAKEIGKKEYDIVTGGGPGLMDAANAGHEAGDENNHSDSIGLIIKLPWEAKENNHLEYQKVFTKFSNRLDHFMALSNVIVVVPGGIGTCLELFYTWQLIQVKHIDPMPIILVGEMWEELIKWAKKYPLKKKLISKDDFKHIHIAKTKEDAMKIINKEYKSFKSKKVKYNGNKKAYKIK